MAFQISIGDILMLSKLAWDISQAFTSGRKSAPAEFQEVQNQLISLTHALESLKSLSSETSGPEDGYSFNTIAPILQNCRFTLEHLEALVSKYMVIVKDSGLDGSEKKRWREELQKNWKKVRWTREGGDLMRLQHNLGVHITSLNLTITVLNSANNQKLGQQVHDAHEMLKEIHVWFTSNLKDRPISFNEAPSTPQEESLKLAFSLHRGDDELFETAPLCDNASFNVDWLRGPDEDKPVFKCNCQLRRTTYGDIHDEELGQYLESQMTLIVCSNGLSQSWKILWLTRASRLTSLIIRSITPSGLGIFDGIISKLAITMARKAWNRGAASLMAYPSINPYTELPVIFVLNMLCETGRLYGKIETVKFTANGRSYSTGPIEAVQMVHYRNLTETLAWSFNEAADLILDARSDTHNSDSIEDEAVEYTITVSDQTLITHGENASVVRIAEADCLSRTESGQENTVKGVGVEIELPDINSAIYFVQQLNSLQEGLLGVRTQELLRNEKLAFKIDLGIMIVYDYQITNAVLYLVMNVQTKNYRMLISNASRSICLSIELSSEALRQVSESEQISIPCDGPVWIAECSNLDRKIVYQQRSRSGLTCADRRAQQLLMLMLQSVVRGDHTNAYPMIEGRQYEIEG